MLTTIHLCAIIYIVKGGINVEEKERNKEMTDNEIKLAKASALKDVLIFLLNYQKENGNCSKEELYSETVKFLEEKIEVYE